MSVKDIAAIYYYLGAGSVAWISVMVAAKCLI
jgi:hypothetical protein